MLYASTVSTTEQTSTGFYMAWMAVVAAHVCVYGMGVVLYRSGGCVMAALTGTCQIMSVLMHVL